MPPQIKARKGMKMAPVSGKQQLHSISRLLKYVFKYYPWQFFSVLLCIVFSSVAGVAGSYFVGNILVDVYIEPSLTNWTGEIITPTSGFLAGLPFSGAIIIMGIIYLVGVLSSFLYNVLMSRIGQGIMKRIRDELFGHMQDLSIAYFDRRGHGDIMSVYTNDVDALREMFARALPMVANSLMTMIACTVMMLLTDLILTAVVFAFAVLIFFVSKYYSKMSARYFIKQQISLGAMNGYIEEMINGQRVVKVFNYEKRNIDGFTKRNEEFFDNAVKANRFANVLMPTVNQLGNLQYAIVALIGCLAIINSLPNFSLLGQSTFTIGLIVSFLMYSKSFVNPIGQVSQQLNTIALALAGATRIFEILDEPVESDDGYVGLTNATAGAYGEPIPCDEHTGKWAWKHPHQDGSVTYTWLKGDIVFENVDFSYVPGKRVLKHINLYAKPGQKVAFVGPTGAGKTTITNLINRFYDIDSGKIRYDGINIEKISKKDLRRSLGIVLQETKLFTGSIKDNIRMGKLEATDEEIINAAKLANAHDFIVNLPQGYDTIIKGSDSSLSQGQRQLIAIARAAVADPPVMILDEATSSIDSRTEALVQRGMDAIMKGRTVFVIAHRLSTVKNSDVIMVIDHGEIIERGSHDDLLAEKGKYYQLYTGNKAEN